MSGREGLQPAERLWTPWRMTYVGGGTGSQGCVFCNARDGDDDARSLVLHRGDSCFVIMNLYPYNTGHVMVVPNDHLHDLGALSPETRAEMAELTASFCTGLRLALRCEGFNTGMNLGEVAGAGIADHLHQHIVPRWKGDANFMPLVGSTKVLPELIPATYAKLRADVARRRSGRNEVAIVAALPDRTQVVLDGDRLPRIALEDEAPTWPGALASMREWASSIELIGWAGPVSTRDDASVAPALAALVTPSSPGTLNVVDIDEARGGLDEADRAIVAACIERGILAPP